MPKISKKNQADTSNSWLKKQTKLKKVGGILKSSGRQTVKATRAHKVDLLQLMAERGINVDISPSSLVSKKVKVSKKYAQPPQFVTVELAKGVKRAAVGGPKKIKIHFWQTKRGQKISPHILDLKQWLSLDVAQRRELLATALSTEHTFQPKLPEAWWLKFWLLEHSIIWQKIDQLWTVRRRPDQPKHLRLAEPAWTPEQFWSSRLERSASVQPWQNLSLISLLSLVVWPIKVISQKLLGQAAGTDLGSVKNYSAPLKSLVIENDFSDETGQNNLWPQSVAGSYFSTFFNLSFYQAGRSALFFSLSALILVLPFFTFIYYRYLQNNSGQVLGISTQAVNQLAAAGQAASQLNLNLAQQEFASAQQSFVLASQQLQDLSGLLGRVAAILPWSNQLQSGQGVLLAGQNLAAAGQDLSQGFLPLVDGQAQANLTDKLRFLGTKVGLAQAKVALAEQNMKQVEVKQIPLAKRELWEKARLTVPQLAAQLKFFGQAIDLISGLLGEKEPSRVLVLFQNNNELRATGGFIGSYALVDVYHGAIKKLEVPGGGSYDLKGGLKQRVIPPEPLQAINPLWTFWDANWWPDFKQSAEKILWFYQKSGGPSADYVIAINSQLMSELLKVLGPVEVGTQKIEADNLESILQTSSQAQAGVAGGKPKQLITDLTPLVLEKILQASPQQLVEILGVLAAALPRKDLLLYAVQPEQQAKLATLGWSGEIKASPVDYLSVISTNIDGGKTDGVVLQEIRQQVNISDQGEVVNTLIIKRSHLGSLADSFTAVPNLSYLRIYVPLGSTLLTAQGFSPPPSTKRAILTDDFAITDSLLVAENQAMIDRQSGTKIYTDLNKTVFANWLQLKVGEGKEIILQYRLPKSILVKVDSSNWANKIKNIFGNVNSSANYSLLLQRQPGSQESPVFVQVLFAPPFSPYWLYPENSQIQARQLDWQNSLTNDLYYQAAFTVNSQLN